MSVGLACMPFETQKVLWPDMYDYQRLMIIAHTSGH